MDSHRSLQGPGEGESISEPPLLTEHPVLDISCNVNKKLGVGGDPICDEVSDTGRRGRGRREGGYKDIYLKNT